MIVGNRVTKIEAAREKQEPRKGLNFKINIKDAKVTGKRVDITYEYSADYTEDVGYIRMEGVIAAEEEKKLLDEIKDEWSKKQRLPQSYAEVILNAINYFGGVNGVLAARVVNLSPPIVPPRFSLSKKE
ncbi:hypothetical protein GF412_03035 [Candidatus Micrarchaeota archaeon]|nr:hypothetical protein [Candidatus Micrarchaeota archaeon]MBD3417927.1 hypothetical protein [Candidatus Micrarchaeota archaeon]